MPSELKTPSSVAPLPPGAKQASAGATVLMIDDEKLNSFVVAVYLKAAGYRELVHTTDPMNAISLATKLRPDIILLDIEMPRLSGIELLRRIRADESLADTVVVILSATDDEQIKSQAIALQVSGFLRKPIRKNELLAALESASAAARAPACQGH
ncbi:MAG TPA: response regulator [Pirellulales bacterium]|jgi:CheY-like chemotaxis protein|nr:response regulator [Pirellulales bacterium]